MAESILDTKHGKIIARYPNDYITQCLQKSGEYEWYVIEIINRLCQQHSDGVILDVGANIGTVCLPLAQRFPNMQILAYEIQPNIADLLEDNVRLNQLSNIEVYRYGLSDTQTSMSVASFDCQTTHNIGAFSLDPWVWDNSPISRGSGPEINIDLKRLDDITVESAIRCIKLDVEGYEQKVLLGGRDTIASHGHPPIVYELWGYNPWWKERAQNLAMMLVSWGYSLQSINDAVIAVHASWNK